jgi:hypothetical protein
MESDYSGWDMKLQNPGGVPSGILSMMTRNSSRKIFAFIDNRRFRMPQNLQELHG